MKAIILAAGIGKRLGNTGHNKPKCLLEFNGMTLLHRHLKILDKSGIIEILIVTGYHEDMIKKELRETKLNLRVTTIFNPDFKAGSVVSLWCSRELLTEDQDILLMDADVLYDPRILQALVKTQYSNCFLLDKDFEAGDEPVKLCIKDGYPIDFRKQIDEDLQFDFQGESVGFFRFSGSMAKKIAEQAGQYIQNGRHHEPYEEVIRDLLLAEPETFSFEDISGLAWIEIDFPEDVERARTEILGNMEMIQN